MINLVDILQIILNTEAILYFLDGQNAPDVSILLDQFLKIGEKPVGQKYH